MTKKGNFLRNKSSILCRKRAFDANRRCARFGGLEAIQGKMKICQHLPNYTHKLWLVCCFGSIYYFIQWLSVTQTGLSATLSLSPPLPCLYFLFYPNQPKQVRGEGEVCLTFLPTGEFVSWPLRLCFALALEEHLLVSLSIAKKRFEWHLWMWFSALHIKVDWLNLGDLAEIQNNNIVSDLNPRFLLVF